MENYLTPSQMQTELEKPISKIAITDDNFSNYFFPAREDYKPQKGQILARWRATADFVDGWIKRNVIELLCVNNIGAETARRIMYRLVCATDQDSVRVMLEMCEDLVSGMSVDEVAEKPYRFVIEQFYWTNKEYVPHDPHWEIINIRDLRDDSYFRLSNGAKSATV